MLACIIAGVCVGGRALLQTSLSNVWLHVAILLQNVTASGAIWLVWLRTLQAETSQCWLLAVLAVCLVYDC